MEDNTMCEICGAEKKFQAQYSAYSDEIMEGEYCENIHCGMVEITCPRCSGKGKIAMVDWLTEGAFTQICGDCVGTGKIWGIPDKRKKRKEKVNG